MAVDEVVVETTCQTCRKLVKDDEFALECEGFCEKWYHSKCIGVGKRNYDKIVALKEDSTWYCGPCKSEVNALIKSRRELLKVGKSLNVSDKPALSVILDEIFTLNANYLMLEKRIIDIEGKKCQVDHAVNDVTQKGNHDAADDVTVPTATQGNLDQETNRTGTNVNETPCEAREPALAYSQALLGKGKKARPVAGNGITEAVDLKTNGISAQAVHVDGHFHVEAGTDGNSLDEINSVVDLPGKSEDNDSNWITQTRKKRNKANIVAGSNRGQNRLVVVGSRDPSDAISAVSAVDKFSWIFVSRLATNVTKEDIVDYIKGICGDTSIIGEELKTKFPGYKSFKVRIPFSANGKILSPEVWPKGVLVSKFLFPRNKSGQSLPLVGKPFLGPTQQTASAR
jgi:hypothetical protein